MLFASLNKKQVQRCTGSFHNFCINAVINHNIYIYYIYIHVPYANGPNYIHSACMSVDTIHPPVIVSSL